MSMTTMAVFDCGSRERGERRSSTGRRATIVEKTFVSCPTTMLDL